MTDYLVDNSVWARLASADARVSSRLRRIERAPSDLFVACPPQVLEFCHSARTPGEYAEYRERISLGFPLERAPDESLVLDIQSALWRSGLVRAAGPLDIPIAGYAIVNDATVLAAHHDFDPICLGYRPETRVRGTSAVTPQGAVVSQRPAGRAG